MAAALIIVAKIVLMANANLRCVMEKSAARISAAAAVGPVLRVGCATSRERVFIPIVRTSVQQKMKNRNSTHTMIALVERIVQLMTTVVRISASNAERSP